MQEDKNGEDMTITPGSTDLVYIRSCSQCKFGVHGRSAKCIIGKLYPHPLPCAHTYICLCRIYRMHASSIYRIQPSMTVNILGSPESCKDVKVEFEEPIMSGTLVCKTHVTDHPGS